MSDDLISRQAAIDALDTIELEVADGEGFRYAKWREYFCDLPSAQPDVPDICVGDMISRQSAIDDLRGKDPSQIWDTADIEVWVNALPSAQPETHEKRTETHACDCISRQAAIDVLSLGKEILSRVLDDIDVVGIDREKYSWGLRLIESNINDIEELPSTQPERDIPIKPIETTDNAWGIPYRQAVCPKCNYYLGHIAFLDSYKGKRVTYCETCGQAIDWEGWVFDE